MPPKPQTQQRWRIILALFAIAAVSFLDRNNISIAAAALQQDFALSNVQLGVVFSGFVAGYALAQPLAGRIADLFGPTRVIAIGIVWWSALTAATAMVPAGYGWSMALLIAVRFLLGLGEAVIFPASNRMVANWIPARERGLANGIIFAGVGVGAGIAPPLITAILIHADWKSAFYASALIGLVMLAFWLLSVKDRPEQMAAVSPSELAYIRDGVSSPPQAVPMGWGQILRNRTLALLAFSYFTYGYVAYIFFTWFFKYLSGVRGLDLKSSGIYGMLPFIAMAIASPLGGYFADRISTSKGTRIGRCLTASLALSVAGLFVALATQVDDARLATLFLAGGAGALYMSQSAFWTISANLGGRSAGSVSGLMNMANQIGGVVTASLTPWLADTYGWTASFVFAAGLSLLGALAWLFINPEDRLDPAL
ncbi:MFS transporter [Novosphingobium umbonatum]|uniref:MFS transporter n=1 Tax=Novosphingobium umbonatum TaxID=1908524 RepID=A0A437MZY7_9SPHN|nr:MFS transporter [Novosphingobium umbonatum]